MRLTEDQAAIANAVGLFMQAEVRPHSVSFERNQGFPSQLFEKMGELGLMGMLAPTSAGGTGADYMSFALALIEVAAADGAALRRGVLSSAATR